MNKEKIENKYRAITLVNQIIEKLRSYHLQLHLLSFTPLFFTNLLLEAWSPLNNEFVFIQFHANKWVLCFPQCEI